jgi:dynein heavy chain
MIEDHMNQLNQFAVMRHVGPFRAEVSEKIALLGTVYDTIEKWLKVQGLWSGLVSVFIGGDIAKQLPGDAARFLKVHKVWLKIMERANEQRNVVQCCNDDILTNSLNGLQADLEHCQKQLESYLDGKRGLFPRFYFCSPEDLLKILSLGSDPQAVQDDFEKLFQAITQVTFDEENPKLITTIHQRFAGATEDVVLHEDVLAEGPIEEWLMDLTNEMMRSIRQKCRIGAQDCNSLPLPEFVNGSASQIALLGIQMQWTSKMEYALDRTNAKDRREELDRKTKEVVQTLHELSAMCLDGTLNKLNRTKIETLVTIQVHQRDLSDTIR